MDRTGCSKIGIYTIPHIITQKKKKSGYPNLFLRDVMLAVRTHATWLFRKQGTEKKKKTKTRNCRWEELFLGFGLFHLTLVDPANRIESLEENLEGVGYLKLSC